MLLCCGVACDVVLCVVVFLYVLVCLCVFVLVRVRVWLCVVFACVAGRVCVCLFQCLLDCLLC